jgi:hypothetical protein
VLLIDNGAKLRRKLALFNFYRYFFQSYLPPRRNGASVEWERGLRRLPCAFFVAAGFSAKLYIYNVCRGPAGCRRSSWRGAKALRAPNLKAVSMVLYAEAPSSKAGKRPCLFPAHLWRNFLVMTAKQIRRLLVWVDTRWLVDSPLALA